MSLALADETSLRLNERTLLVGGTLQAGQADRLTGLAGAHPLINAVDLSGIRLNAEEALRLVRLQLGAPDSVELTADDGRIMVSGNADISWYRERTTESQMFGGWILDFSPLLAELQTRVRANADQLNGTAFLFTSQDHLTPESLTALDMFAQQLSGLLESSRALDIDLTITLTGQVDGTGTAEQNERTSRKRVKVVMDGLSGAGMDTSRLLSEIPVWRSGSEDLSQRRVTVKITWQDRP